MALQQWSNRNVDHEWVLCVIYGSRQTGAIVVVHAGHSIVLAK
jgi:hypothetical protein